ncbi:MAG: hypothetical protein ACRENE_05700, partial [Polyangiaceae bacterium]
VTLSLGYASSIAVVPEGDPQTSVPGLFLGGEYWARLYSWVNVRAYAGFLATSTDQSRCQLAGGCDVSEEVVVLGAKGRLMAPIPWVAPFIELGLGLSIGTIHATDVGVDRIRHGAVIDLPIGFGLSLGPKHNVDLGAIILDHGGAEATGAALYVGVSLPVP